MKRVWILSGALLLLLAVGLVPVLSQDMGGEGEGGEEPACGNPEEAWKKLHEPGDPHKLLARMTGDWDLELKMWMQPGAEPMVSKATSSSEAAYGGRFVTGTYEMKDGPFPHKGETWFGYSNTSKKYQFIRITDMDTNMRIYEGDYDEKAKQLTFKAEYSMEWNGQKFNVRERNVYTFESDDKFKLEVFSFYEGMPDMPEEGVKEVEINYTRKK